MHRLVVAVGILSMGLTACLARPSTGAVTVTVSATSTAPSSQVITVSPTIRVEPTQAPVEPKTLEAATAAAQEAANRYTSGDYAGAWQMKSKQFQNNVSEADYVTYNNTCTRTNPVSGTPITVTGIRMDGNDKALVRWEIRGHQQSNAMLYEDGKWVDAPTDFWAENFGKPVEQVIAEAKAKGEC
jgi:hypothetical protein